MGFRRAFGATWHYFRGTRVLPAAVAVIVGLAIRDALVPEVPLWVGLVEFPLFLAAMFVPLVDAGRREDRWHAARGWIWNATEPRRRGWWSAQFGFLVSQLKRPAWWAPTALKVIILLTVVRLAPETVRYVALLPVAVAVAAVVSILATNWRLQRPWDRFVPAGDLPPWAQRWVDRWPLTAATVGLILAGASGAMAVYFFALDQWPVELVVSVQCFWAAVTALRRLSMDAPWRRPEVATPTPAAQSSRAA
jgi:hypothetical protein